MCNFEDLPDCFPKWPHLPPAASRGSSHCTPLLTLVTLSLCDGILVDVQWYLVVVDLHFPEGQWWWSFFHVLSYLERLLFRSFAHRLIRLSFYCWVLRVICFFWTLDPWQMCDVWTFSPILGVLFSLSWWCPWNTHGFNFDEVRFISIFQLSHVFLGSYLIEFVFRLMFLSVTFLSQMIWYLEITFSSAPPSDFEGLLGGELFTLSQDSLLRCIYTLLLPTFNAQASDYL